MKSCYNIEILSVKVPEKISRTKKQYIHMLHFISIASDSKGFSVTKPVALVTSVITPTFSIKSFF